MLKSAKTRQISPRTAAFSQQLSPVCVRAGGRVCVRASPVSQCCLSSLYTFGLAAVKTPILKALLHSHCMLYMCG